MVGQRVTRARASSLVHRQRGAVDPRPRRAGVNRLVGLDGLPGRLRGDPAHWKDWSSLDRGKRPFIPPSTKTVAVVCRYLVPPAAHGAAHGACHMLLICCSYAAHMLLI